MKDKVTLRALRAYNYYEAARTNLRQRAAKLLAEREAGMENIPWTMILMIVGAVVAVGIGVWVIAFVKGHLASVPSDPTY